MAVDTLCPGCDHSLRRHASYGCTANAGACECAMTQEQIGGEPPAPPVDVRADASRSPMENALARAQAAGGKLAVRADRIVALVVALEAELAEAERFIAQERRVQELRAELERATHRLRELRGGVKTAAVKPAAATSDGGPTPREVREWAAAAGVKCGAIGRVPGPVMQKYLAAHPVGSR